MYILTIYGKETEGAYSVLDEEGDQILYLFEEIEDEVMIKTCEMHDYKYALISKNDVVIPPKTEHDFI